MKKAIIFMLLLLVTSASFSQQTNSSPPFSKNVYLQKSKKQIKVAFILFGGGSALIATGFIFASAYSDEFFGGAIYLVTIGGPGMLMYMASIPFFAASAKNKKRSMSFSFKNETAPQIQKKSFVYKSVPSVALKINL